MNFVALILVSALLISVVLLWRVHTRAYYELEKKVENRLGPVRGELDGIGQFAYTSSGLIPQLNNIASKFGNDLNDEESALMRRSRVSYYVGGSLGILAFLTVLVWVNIR